MMNSILGGAIGVIMFLMTYGIVICALAIGFITVRAFGEFVAPEGDEDTQ
jgi:hypothetical protein